MLQPPVLSGYDYTIDNVAGAPLALIALTLNESQLTSIGIVESQGLPTSASSSIISGERTPATPARTPVLICVLIALQCDALRLQGGHSQTMTGPRSSFTWAMQVLIWHAHSSIFFSLGLL